MYCRLICFSGIRMFYLLQTRLGITSIMNTLTRLTLICSVLDYSIILGISLTDGLISDSVLLNVPYSSICLIYDNFDNRLFIHGEPFDPVCPWLHCWLWLHSQRHTDEHESISRIISLKGMQAT